MISRRSALNATGLAAAAILGGRFASAAAALPDASRRSEFVLGAAGYTFNKFDIDKTLEMLRKVDVHYLCIKDFHLPLKSTDAEITAFHEKCRNSGVTGYGVGPIYMGSEQEVSDAFVYARRVGVRILVGVPFKMMDKKRLASPELLNLVNDKVREYDIRYAVHNHGPDMPELFPNAESVMDVIRSMDKRVGLCLDIGHQFRDGKDPIQAVRSFGDRIHDIHLKNVTAADKSGRAAELPRGKINLPAFVHALREAGYRGVCGLEYEKDMENPLSGIAESVGYFKGLMDATRAA